MAVRPNAAASGAILDEGLDAWDGATLEIYTGTQPGTGGAATGETLLASITLPTPAFAAADGRSRSPAANWTGSVSTSGTAGWARLTNASTEVIDLNIVESPTEGDLQLDDVTLVEGGTVSVTGGNITLPGNDA
jgi:hypothetical protein